MEYQTNGFEIKRCLKDSVITCIQSSKSTHDYFQRVSKQTSKYCFPQMCEYIRMGRPVFCTTKGKDKLVMIYEKLITLK